MFTLLLIFNYVIPWSRVLPEKLIACLVKKLHYLPEKILQLLFITIRFDFILRSAHRPLKWSVSFCFPHQISLCISCLSAECRVIRKANIFLLLFNIA